MSDDNDFSDIPTGKTARLRYSINNLWDQWGNVDNERLGLVINLGLASFGVLAWVAFSGLLAWAGVAWAVLNIVPVIQWVLRL